MSSGIGQHENDKRWMLAALAEARKAEGRTGTNPPVGCVLISSDNKLIAAGHTKPNGRPHAEAVALAEAGSAGLAHRMVGGTAYVTLEPCAHHGKTPPCAEALRDAGIAFEEREFSMEELRRAREAFITSATSFVKPITKVDGMPVGDGEVGPVVRKLFDIFARHVKGAMRNAA